MKIHFTVAFFLFLNSLYAQNCGCEEFPELQDAISCKRTHLNNGTQVYWQYNCDSSWLIFKSPKGRIISLYSLEAGLMEYTGRLGFSYSTEYQRVFLIRNNLISGCCTPPEYYLFNKKTGKQSNFLGRLIFFSEIPKYPFIIYFQNHKSKFLPNTKDPYNFIILKNLNTNHTYKINLPAGRILRTLKSGENLYPEHLIEDVGIYNKKLKITYRFKSKRTWRSARLLLNLRKYAS